MQASSVSCCRLGVTVVHGSNREQLTLWPGYSNSHRKKDILIKAQAAGGAATPAKAGGKGCAACRGKGAVECPGCKGSGKNKKNGNMFERWKCYDCQGFGLISCKNCGAGGRGLTPEQRGER